MDKPARFWSYTLFRAWEFSTFVIAGYLAKSAVNAGAWAVDVPFVTQAQFTAIAFMVGAALWVAWLSKSDLYASHRLTERKNELVQVLIGAIYAAGCLAIVGAFSHLPMNEPSFLAVFFVSLFVMTSIGRILTRGMLRLARAKKRNLRHVAIVGDGVQLRNLVWHIFHSTESGVIISGVFGSRKDLRGLPEDVPIGGDLDDLTNRMMREPIDEVLVTRSKADHFEDIVKLIDRCRRVGVKVRVVDATLTPFGMRPKIEYIGDTFSLAYEDAPDWGWRGKVKDGIDALVSAAAIFALLPVFIIVAIAIKIDSPGPVFFVQKRVGKNRVTFPFYKFRTMRKDAAEIQASLEAQNESAGPTFKIAKDPRVTGVGRVLRKYSIDELPQFLNVLKGEMSLVGPRPLPIRDVERFDTDWHSRRFSVKPGLTCSWVIGGRSELSFENWVEMDLAYIDNWSLKKDFSIILNTIPAVVRGSGAY